MITSKQFTLRQLINNDVIADRLNAFIEDYELLALINGVIVEVSHIDKTQFEIQYLKINNYSINSLKIKEYEIIKGCQIKVFVECEVKVWYNANKSNWDYRPSSDFYQKGTAQVKTDAIIIPYDKVKFFGFTCIYK